MTIKRTDFLLAILLLVVSGVATNALAQPEHLFYYLNEATSFETFRTHVDKIDVVAPEAFSVDEDGVVWGSLDRRILELAAAHGVEVMPLIVNPGFDQEMLHALLANDSARARAIETMLDECRRLNLAGIQFDFENINMNDRDAFSDFVRETADALHAAGFKLSIAVVHRPYKEPGPNEYFKWLFKNWRAGYDLTALSDAVDFISVMTYSQHTRRTPPGPNAGIPWMRDNIAFFLQSVPPEKLSLGIAVTTPHWRVELNDDRFTLHAGSSSRSLKYPDAIAVAERYGAEWTWLEDQGVAYTFFDNGGLFEWIFLEDARSFERKYELVGENGLRGISVWVLGYEDPGIWDVVP